MDTYSFEFFHNHLGIPFIPRDTTRVAVAICYFHLISLVVRSILHLSHDIIPLAEEREPLVQHRLLLVIQVVPIRCAVLGFERRARQSTRGVFSGEYCRYSASHLCHCNPRQGWVRIRCAYRGIVPSDYTRGSC